MHFFFFFRNGQLNKKHTQMRDMTVIKSHPYITAKGGSSEG